MKNGFNGYSGIEAVSNNHMKCVHKLAMPKPALDKIVQMDTNNGFIYGLSERGNVYYYNGHIKGWEFVESSPALKNEE